jgi:competence ComEA-like helix-hairpin-helix protein
VFHPRAAGISVLVVLCALALPGLAKKKPPAHPVNLNTATAAELQQVPGIGPSTADKILQMRKSYGAFKTVDDLRAVRGIGEKRLAKMRKYLTVGKPVQAKKTGTTAPQAGGPQAKAPPAKAKVTVAPKPVPDTAANEDEEP